MEDALAAILTSVQRCIIVILNTAARVLTEITKSDHISLGFIKVEWENEPLSSSPS